MDIPSLSSTLLRKLQNTSTSNSTTATHANSAPTTTKAIIVTSVVLCLVLVPLMLIVLGKLIERFFGQQKQPKQTAKDTIANSSM